jgi:elongation factor P--(R)-beta-lysine ligase
MSSRLSRGRIVALAPGEVVLHGEGGVTRVAVRDLGEAQVGDLVVVEDARVRVATRGRSADPGAAQRRLLAPRRLRAMAIRAQVEDGVRAFFRGRGFREVRTPCLVDCPGMEPHIVPFQVGTAGWLQTSPEFAMKRLLSGGLERIFQVAPVFRDEPDAPTHRREFTMLEWYRAWAGEDDIQRDVEELVHALALAVHGRPALPWRGGTVDVSLPWPRLTTEELFRQHAGVELLADDLRAACARLGLATAEGDSWDDLYFRIWLAVIEPALPARGILVTRYPASQAALAVVDGPWARRFEVYAGGLELGNAFEELTDPAEQRRRFEEGRRDPGPPMPEAFLAALEDGMPPSGGIAVGLDRLVMLLAGEDDIGYTSWLG